MAGEPRMPWLRLWTDIIDDEKLGLLAFEDRWHYVAILCMKRRGILDAEDTAELRDRKVGMKLGLGDADRDAVRQRLLEIRLIDENWQPLAWSKRQPPSDIDSTGAERQRRHRDKARNGDVTRDSPVTFCDVTVCHADVTVGDFVTVEDHASTGHTKVEKLSLSPPRGPQAEHVTRDSPVTNGSVTRESPGSESESESEKIPSASATPAQKVSRGTRGADPEWFLDFKLAYPNRAGDQGWRKAQRAAHARISEGHAPSEFIEGAKRYAAYCRATGKVDTEFVKQACTFLGPEKPFLLAWEIPLSAPDRSRAAGRFNTA